MSRRKCKTYVNTEYRNRIVLTNLNNHEQEKKNSTLFSLHCRIAPIQTHNSKKKWYNR